MEFGFYHFHFRPSFSGLFLGFRAVRLFIRKYVDVFDPMAICADILLSSTNYARKLTPGE